MRNLNRKELPAQKMEWRLPEAEGEEKENTGRATVTHLSTSFLAKPKSVSLTWPSLSSRMFSGFRSL